MGRYAFSSKFTHEEAIPEDMDIGAHESTNGGTSVIRSRMTNSEKSLPFLALYRDLEIPPKNVLFI